MGYIDERARVAISATVHCLTGCAIGEILGLVLATWWGWGNLPSVALAVVLAFGFGYGLTVSAVARSLPAREAVHVALAADTTSIAVMELVDNGFVLLVPGAMSAGLGDALFWWSLAVGLALAFVAALPVNRFLIGRGRGRAAVHEHHH